MATAEQVQTVSDLHRTFSDRDADGFASYLADGAILRPSTLIAGSAPTSCSRFFEAVTGTR